MRFAVSSVAVVAVFGLAACASPNRPTDVGSMQLPAPTQTGVYGTNRPGVDTGSMSQPAPSGGVVTSGPATPDTGSMALPRNAQGNAAPRRR